MLGRMQRAGQKLTVITMIAKFFVIRRQRHVFQGGDFDVINVDVTWRGDGVAHEVNKCVDTEFNRRELQGFEA